MRVAGTVAETDWGTAAATGRRRGPMARLAATIDAEQEQWDLWLPVAFGAGIATYFLALREPPLWIGLIAVVTALALHMGLPRTGGVRFATRLLVWLAVGFTVAALRTAWVAAPVLARATGPITVEGFIELIEPRETRGARYTLAVTKAGTFDDTQRPAKVRIRTLAAETKHAPGDHVRVTATLSPPPGPALPGGFDFARGAWFQRLGAVGFATGAIEIAPPAREAELGLRARAAIESVRQAIGQRITAALPGETGHIVNALITGERGGITAATNQAYRDSGLFHILSISGLHMSIMAGAVFVGLRLLLAAFPAIALVYPIKKWAAAAAIAGAFGYLLISGAQFATVRSWIMITVMFAAVLLDRPALALRNVAVAALLILIVWPESLLDPGFQMSFAAVVALVTTYEEWRRWTERAGRDGRRLGLAHRIVRALGGILGSTLVAGLAVAPFGLYHFHASQPYAMLANVIAIPICNLVVMPAALLVLVGMPFGLEAGPLALMGWGVDAMSAAARWVAGLSGAVWRTAAIPPIAFALFVAGGLWLCLWRTRWRVLGLALIALASALAPLGPRPDILIGARGGLVAVRGQGGELSALALKAQTFELARWLEHDGDGRKAEAAAKAAAFRCDAVGCVATIAKTRVSVAASAAALRDDCAVADVLVLRGAGALPAACERAGAVRISPAEVARAGTHAIYLTAAGTRVETVASVRGARPWSMLPAQADRRERDITPNRPATGIDRLGAYAGLRIVYQGRRPLDDDAAATDDATDDP